MDGGVIVVTEQTNKKLMLDESPDMTLQFKWRKFGGAIFTATQAMEHIREGRRSGRLQQDAAPRCVAESADRYGRDPATREIFRQVPPPRQE
jgi:hypothetical protein